MAEATLSSHASPNLSAVDPAPAVTGAAPSQRDQAYAGLRRLLILQKLPEGERLREPVWARELGVNRMALREAFARLEAEGLIERGPKTGYFVPRLSDEDIREILEVRTFLECGAIDLLSACDRRLREERLGAMVERCDQLEDLIGKNYLLGASEADRQFHEALIASAGNARLTLIYQRAPLPMIHRQLIATDRWAPECHRTLAEHREIIAAIRQGEAERAKAVMREHLSERYLLPIPT